MSEISLPLDIESLEITGQAIDNKGNIMLDVVSKNDHSTCHKCGRPATKRNGVAPIRMVRDLPIFDKPVYLRIKPSRYLCEYCDDHPTTTEQYDWCGRNATTTKGLEEYLMRQLIHSTIEDVSKKDEISSKAVQTILNRQVNCQINWNKIGAIDTIGIDEIALRKGHHSYMTVISAKTKPDQLFVLDVLPGRSKEDVKSFLESIPTDIKRRIKSVCTDMYDGYVNAAIDVFGVQALVVDRYHVSKLYRKPLDRLRVREMARLKTELSKSEYSKLEGMMWILRKQHECLSEADKEKLQLLYHYSPVLKKAHRYALKLTQIFNAHCSRKSGVAKINRWIKSVAKRRCYGLFKADTIFQRLFLDLQGYKCYA